VSITGEDPFKGVGPRAISREYFSTRGADKTGPMDDDSVGRIEVKARRAMYRCR